MNHLPIASVDVEKMKQWVADGPVRAEGYEIFGWDGNVPSWARRRPNRRSRSPPPARPVSHPLLHLLDIDRRDRQMVHMDRLLDLGADELGELGPRHSAVGVADKARAAFPLCKRHEVGKQLRADAVAAMIGAHRHIAEEDVGVVVVIRVDANTGRTDEFAVGRPGADRPAAQARRACCGTERSPVRAVSAGPQEVPQPEAFAELDACAISSSVNSSGLCSV